MSVTALREGLATVDRSAQLGLLRFSGRDRCGFLQRILSNDVQGLMAGQGCPAALLTPKSQVVCTLELLVTDEEVWAIVPQDALETVCEALDRFIIADDVEVAIDGRSCVAVYGSQVDTLVELGPLVALAPYHHRAVTVFGVPALAVADDALGATGLLLFVASDSVAALVAELSARGAAAATADDVELARVEAGTPRFGAELDQNHLILEGGQLARVSLQKGCYIGQEPVCRIISRGQVARRLVGLRILGEGRLSAPAAGEKLDHAEKADAGLLTSVVRSPTRGLIALGYVHRRFAAPGARLSISSGGEAEVVALPHVPARGCDKSLGPDDLQGQPTTFPRYKVSARELQSRPR